METAHRDNRSFLLRGGAILLGLTVFLLDYLSKALVEKTYWLWNYSVWDGLLTIQYATNRGIAFGLLHNVESAWKGPLLAAMALVAIGLVVYYIWTTPPEDRLVFVALGLLLGGISGNFADRLGDDSVVDFIRVHWGDAFSWPTFNLADSAITVGVLLILLLTLFAPHDHDEQQAPAPETGEETVTAE